MRIYHIVSTLEGGERLHVTAATLLEAVSTARKLAHEARPPDCFIAYTGNLSYVVGRSTVAPPWATVSIVAEVEGEGAATLKVA